MKQAGEGQKQPEKNECSILHSVVIRVNTGDQ
jgi:hypothetical protein